MRGLDAYIYVAVRASEQVRVRVCVRAASVSGSPQAPAVIGRASRGVEELARLAPPQQIEEQIHRDPGSRRKELWEKARRGSFFLHGGGKEGEVWGGVRE